MYIGNDLIVGSDYTKLRTRCSCYVMVCSSGDESNSDYALVRHFITFSHKDTNSTEAYVGLHFMGTAGSLHSFPIVYDKVSELQYIPLQYIIRKVNLFPILDETRNISGYYVTPASNLGS